MTPPLRTERLDLAPLELAHAALLFEGMLDPEIHQYTPHDPPESIQALETTFRRRIAGPRESSERWYNWTPFVRATGDAIGNVQITTFDDGTALLGYFVLRAWWRQGYGAEGCAAALAWAGRELRLRTIDAEIDLENEASIRLVESLGFARIGVATVFMRGLARDEARYQLMLNLGA